MPVPGQEAFILLWWLLLLYVCVSVCVWHVHSSADVGFPGIRVKGIVNCKLSYRGAGNRDSSSLQEQQTLLTLSHLSCPCLSLFLIYFLRQSLAGLKLVAILWSQPSQYQRQVCSTMPALQAFCESLLVLLIGGL